MSNGQATPVVPVSQASSVPLSNRFEPLGMDVGHEEEVRSSAFAASPTSGKRKSVPAQDRVFPLVMHAASVRLADLPRKALVAGFHTFLSNLSFTFKGMRGGDLLLFPGSAEDSLSLQSLTNFGAYSVKVTLPLSVRGCRGIIRGVNKMYTEDDLKSRLIVDGSPVRGVKFLRQSSPDDSAAPVRDWTVLLDFDGPALPSRVQFDFQSFSVSPYKTMPLQCAKCCKFGHIARDCSRVQRCLRCGGSHAFSSCPVPSLLVCPNCKGTHHGKSKQCPAYRVAESAIGLVRRHGMSYRDAVTMARGPSPSGSVFSSPSAIPSSAVPPRSGPSPPLVSGPGVFAPFWEMLRQFLSSLVSTFTDWLTSFVSGGGLQRCVQSLLSSIFPSGPSP